MKENNELERSDLVVDGDISISDENPNGIVAFLETWFDVDKKFGIHTADRDDEWLDLFVEYDVADGTLKATGCVSNDDTHRYFDYEPTAAEAQLVKELITEKIQKEYGQTPEEFCAEVLDDSPTMGGIS